MSKKEKTNKKDTPSVVSQAPPPITPTRSYYIPDKPKTKIDYGYWAKMPYWKLVEAVFIIHGLTPKTKAEMTDEIKKTYKLVERSYYSSELKHYQEVDPDLRVKPSDFIEWSKSIGLVVPDELKEPTNRLTEKESKELHDGVFPCRPGTRWEDIKITLTGDDTVRIETPQGKGTYTYHDLKMADRRSKKKPTMIWTLLKSFAKNEGIIAPKNTDYAPELPDTAKRFNAHLKNLFGINESIYQGHYKKIKGYKTRIFFSDQTKAVS